MKKKTQLGELTSAMARLPWVLSVLAADQLKKGIQEKDIADRLERGLDAIITPAQEEIDEPLQGFYKYGDRLNTLAGESVAKSGRILAPMVKTAVGSFQALFRGPK